MYNYYNVNLYMEKKNVDISFRVTVNKIEIINVSFGLKVKAVCGIKMIF